MSFGSETQISNALHKNKEEKMWQKQEKLPYRWPSAIHPLRGTIVFPTCHTGHRFVSQTIGFIYDLYRKLADQDWTEDCTGLCAAAAGMTALGPVIFRPSKMDQ